MSEELKPCPFCGGDNCFHFENFYYCYLGDAGDWNTRPIEDALKSENARLTAEVERLRDGLKRVIFQYDNCAPYDTDNDIEMHRIACEALGVSR